MSDPLAERSCVPCRGGVPPLDAPGIESFRRQLEDGWLVEHGSEVPTDGSRREAPDKLEKSYDFANFVDALAFVNRVGALAEEQGHHPDIHLAWGKVIVWIWTHKIRGLTESDFVLAAKIDALPRA